MSLRNFLLILVSCWLARSAECAELPGLLFHLSFDKQTLTADFAVGEKRPQSQTATECFRFTEGIRGTGLVLQPGQRYVHALAKNLDTRQGTFSCWVKPLNWDGHGKKFRHALVVTAGPQYTMLLYLYPIGDEAVFTHIHVGAGIPSAAVSRAGAPVDLFQRGQWTHLVSTWDAKAVRLYANGRRVAEGLVAAPFPKKETGTISICPIDFWKNKDWGDPAEQTVCDEVRIFGRALTDDEILDLYAAAAPAGVARPNPALVLDMIPHFEAKVLALDVRPAHLDADWKERIAAGATLALTVRDPRGAERFSYSGPLGTGRFTVRLPDWCDGEYRADGELAAGGRKLRGQATLTKPPTPWLSSHRDWRATRVLPPWTPLVRRQGAIRYWNGEAILDGPFPRQLTARDKPLLAGPIRLASGAAATWEYSRITEEEPHRITLSGVGKLGPLSASFTTLMEYDGLLRTDLVLTPPLSGADLSALVLEIPLRAEVATYYRNPVCQPWDGNSLDEPEFLPYAWLGNEDSGLSWFVESAANWRRAKGKPAMTLRREREAVVVRLQIIDQAVRVEKPLTYTIGFEPTPVRPLSPRLYDWRFGSGPQIRGSNIFVYGWGSQISNLNGRLIARNPAEQRRLVDGWRARGQEALSYTCTQCTANISPEYTFFAGAWNQPYGDTFSGYKRAPDNAPYSMVPVCPASSFADFLTWCVHENVRNDWGGGIYTDIDGAMPCDNTAHGCGYTDVFGQTGRSWPLYAHRSLSRRIYETCHDAGKVYFSHQHSRWYSLFNAFNDGWCPGEQYSSAVVGKPTFYMDEIPDRTWRSEFYSPTTGVATFLLPEIGRFSSVQTPEDRGPSESCLAAALAYGVPLWAGGINPRVVEEFWDAQHSFGICGSEFIPFWKQRLVTCSDPRLRVSLWKKQNRMLLAVVNFTDRDRRAELRLSAKGAVVQFRPAWKAESLESSGDSALLTVPAKRGALVLVGP
jgi:hypothetical protein